MSDRKTRETPRAALKRRAGHVEHVAGTLQTDFDNLQESARHIGHELNNLLQAIVAQADGALEEATLSERSIEAFQSILASAAKSAALGRRLLALGRLASPPEFAASPLPPASGPVARRIGVRPAAPASVSLRILVADDQQSNRDLARAVLSKAGYEVAVVSNGAEAVAAVRAEKFDLVLMDLQMPVIDGRTAAREIRLLGHPTSSLTIIAASGGAALDHAESLADAGIDDYIAKPFASAALVAMIDSWLGRDGRALRPARAATSKTSLSELDDLMGRAWVGRGLANLVTQIDVLLSAPEAPIATADGLLVDRAHALVSLAGLLGFSDLSGRCSSLEEAAKAGRGVASALAEAKAAAMPVRAMAVLELGGR